ncbi:hypothetical protein PIB30_016257 [Stylosanthes scabra]|uniref:Uncharacterized protein n=1 Tax=Stylosanthes scabra TaxID=79078 RepID=A0ABU6Y7P6_9FABA|nr:hypothetical protein [Stylosanthes scabra]
MNGASPGRRLLVKRISIILPAKVVAINGEEAAASGNDKVKKPPLETQREIIAVWKKFMLERKKMNDKIMTCSLVIDRGIIVGVIVRVTDGILQGLQKLKSTRALTPVDDEKPTAPLVDSSLDDDHHRRTFGITTHNVVLIKVTSQQNLLLMGLSRLPQITNDLCHLVLPVERRRLPQQQRQKRFQC